MRRALTRTTLTRTTVLALVGALALTGCGAQDRATFEEAVPEAQPVSSPGADDAASTAAPDGSGTGTSDAAARTEGGPRTGTSIPDLVPVEWPDAPRELTETERLFLFEPGPFAGDAYDEDAAFEAARASNPQTTQEWQQAIQAQLQGDYAEDLKTAITFDPSLGEGIAQPTEGDVAASEEVVGTNHFALVLDASGSMGEASGTGTRMEEAKDAIAGFVDTLPEGSTVSLRVYGHEGDNTNAGRSESCAATGTIYAGPADTDELSAQLEAVTPTGWTPLASAIGAAEGDIPAESTDGIVYVVTDGIETCGGDPVSAAEGLAASGIRPIVNVIGFQAGDADQEALAAIATAGGGEYTQADSKAELEDYWDNEYDRMMDAWEEWKRAELDRIDAEGAANMTEAENLGQRLMTGVEQEGDRAVALTERLGAEEAMDYDTKTAVWSYFYNRKVDMWAYSYDIKVDNWSASYNAKVGAWSDVYDTGTSKWSEYYSKKVSN